MFDRVLIANRGEIARRVIRTLRRLGIGSIAIHTPADRGAPFVREAVHAVEISSYLDIDAVVGACARWDAQALHPGYGFLSENPALSKACADAGVTFIGPPPEAAALMGDKLRAKEAARAAGVPVVPVFTGEEARDRSDIYPLLVTVAARFVYREQLERRHALVLGVGVIGIALTVGLPLHQPPNGAASTRLPSPSIRPRHGPGSIRVAIRAWTR